jgi:type II secretory pathway pseudopilin PulG
VKAKAKTRKAKEAESVAAPLVIAGDERRAVVNDESGVVRSHVTRRLRFCLLTFIFCLLVFPTLAQKKPKPALSEKQARVSIAAAPGFKLKPGAVKIKEISPAGTSPVTVTAEVTEAFRLASVEDERVEQDTGVFKKNRLRAVEFRTGDRTWEEFDYLSATLGAERLEAARTAIEELADEYAARQASIKNKGEAESAGANKSGEGAEKTGGEENGAGKKDKSKKKDDKKASVEPLTRGPLTIKSLSSLGSSEVAEVAVEATFTLSKDARGGWVVSEVSFGGGPGVDLSALWPSVNSQKAERARAELSTVRDALEAYRRERGFYVVAEDSVVLMDHLSPRYIKRIVRLDPWHNPYRYTGTTDSYTLASDGPDGKPDTADDVTISH